MVLVTRHLCMSEKVRLIARQLPAVPVTSESFEQRRRQGSQSFELHLQTLEVQSFGTDGTDS
jgi:hypothetical protein